MNLSFFETDSAGLKTFYDKIIGKNETYAPVESFGKYDYKRVSGISECDPDSPIPATMSVKPLFFPKSAKIMKYEENSEGLTIKDTSEDPLAGKRVILGVKHCDARGLQVLEKVYSWDYIDTDFKTRRDNTVIISTRCDKAEATCFCTSLDYDVENSDAHDIRVVKTGNEKVIIHAVTEKGEAFLKANSDGLKAAGADAGNAIGAHYKAFEASFKLKMNYKEVNEKLQQRFESTAFEDVSRNCISCNTCAFICPTCHCFKITDEKIKDEGVRYKSYDSCNNGYFTLMAGGHNPRPVKYRRWRQRAMHKFVYYKERFGNNLCVGCGHCTISCPVNISIFDVVTQVAASEIPA
jgi:sulfhydrogenase subunit beta (sulfur reductase)